MTAHCKLTVFWLAALNGALAVQAGPQDVPAQRNWEFSLITDGYLAPDQDGYASPSFAADHQWLHLEARYNYEDLRTGSVWAGYNLNAGHTLALRVTPMAGVVFGASDGVAAGCEASLTYKKVELSVSNEVVFETRGRTSSFYYAWPQLTYSPIQWLHVGLAAQRTKVYHTGLDTQRGFLFGMSWKELTFTTYVFNVGWTRPTVVLEAGLGF